MFRFLSLALLVLSTTTTPSFVWAVEVPQELQDQFRAASQKLNAVAHHGSASTTTTIHPHDDENDENGEERFLQDGDNERYPRCSVCPPGQAMSKPDVVLPIEFESDPDLDVTCALVRFIGAYGGVSPDICPTLRSEFADDCGCVAETRSGADPRCSVCDQGEEIGRPDFVAAETESGTELTCQDLDDLGYARELTPEECSTVRNGVQGFSQCRCTGSSSSSGSGNGGSPTRAPQTQPTRPTPAPTAATEPTAPTPRQPSGNGGTNSGTTPASTADDDDGGNTTIIIVIVVVVVLLVAVGTGVFCLYKKKSSEGDNNNNNSGKLPSATAIPTGQAVYGQPVYPGKQPYAMSQQQQPYVPSYKQQAYNGGATPDVTAHEEEPMTQVYDL